jgi:PAS domain S-box-containing protein
MENKKIKILAIDDNRDNLITLKAIISEALPQSLVYLEESGHRGIETAKHNHPDVILLDIVMPGMDGYQVCKILKADEKLSEIPVVFLTALKGDKYSRIMALEAGGEAFLAKPVDPTELKAQILAMLKIKEAAAYKRNEKLRLEELVQKRTEELKKANAATLNLLEDLQHENRQRKQSEAALRESEKQYAFLAGTAFDLVKFTSIQDIYAYTARKLFEQLDDEGIVAIVEYDADSNLWNMQQIKGIDDKLDELAKIFGFDLRQLKGDISTKYYEKIISGKLEEVEWDFPGIFNNIISDEIGKTVKKLFSIDKLYCITFQENDKIFGNINLITKKNAKPLNVELIEAFVQQVTNFIKKLKSEEALKANEIKFRTLVDQASEMLFLHDLQGNMVEVNKTAIKITGYSREELGKMNVLDIDPDAHDRDDMHKYWLAMKPEDPPVTFEGRHVRKDGSIYHSEITVSKVEYLGNQYILGLARDITERKKMLEELVAAKEKAQESDKLKTAFLNNISHEIRTPLNGILGFGEFLTEPNLPTETKKEMLAIVQQSSNRLINTVTDYVDMARIVSKTMEVHKKEFKLQPFFEKTIEKTRQLCAAKQLNFMVAIQPESVDLTLDSDPELIRKTLNLLLDNALKFTEKGSITCGCNRNNGFVEFLVQDTGQGIAPKKLDIIFNIFTQEDTSNTRGYEGSGLGLSIAKGLVKLLGGTIGATSEKGKGSTFTFTVPYSETEVAEITAPAEEKNGTVTGKPLVLLAEDDELNAKYMEVVLKKAGCNYLLARNGAEAVAFCKQHPDISLALMDIKMPVMNGLEATKLIREFRPDLPIIATTAYAQTGDEQRFLAAGCDGYLSKPIGKEKLLTQLKKYLNI